MSLRNLINLRIIFSAVFILLMGGATAVWQARQSVQEEVKSSINLALQMIEFGFAQVPLSSRYGSAWLPQFSSLQQTRHLQISISDGGDTPVEFITERVVDEREGVPPNWFVEAVTSEYFTEKYEISMANGTIKTILITADPMDEIVEAWGESQAFFLSVVTMLWVIFLAVNLVFNSMLRAVRQILSGLHQVERGEYDSQLPHFKISEFNAIAVEVNKMSSALKIAQDNNQALARHTMQIQESERQTMSRELHDEMGQSLTAIKAMAMTVKQPQADIPMVTDSIIEICTSLSKVVRSMMKTLHPLSLAELGLTATLTDLVNEWRRRVPYLELQIDCDDQIDELSEEVAIHVYRIVQECITNIVRHAEASQVSIGVFRRETYIDMTIIDNGIGGQVGQQGFGILAMRERAESLGGEFDFSSVEGKGVKVQVRLPFIAKTLEDA